MHEQTPLLVAEAATACANGAHLAPTWAELEKVVHLKYGDNATLGWGPRLRRRFGYFTPDDYYGALLLRQVTSGCRWLDVGCGREVLPWNLALAQLLSARCATLVGVDPDITIHENPLVHERVQSPIEQYHPDRTFDLVTLRMVAEHVTGPTSVAAALARLTRPGGRVVIYTVNRWAPAALAASIVPFWLHHPIKRLLWRTEEKDTFPVAYRMNTHGALQKLFQANGFKEIFFDYLNDLRTLARFRTLHMLELLFWRCFTALGLTYPENCLLGIYERA